MSSVCSADPTVYSWPDGQPTAGTAFSVDGATFFRVDYDGLGDGDDQQLFLVFCFEDEYGNEYRLSVQAQSADYGAAYVDMTAICTNGFATPDTQFYFDDDLTVPPSGTLLLEVHTLDDDSTYFSLMWFDPSSGTVTKSGTYGYPVSTSQNLCSRPGVSQLKWTQIDGYGPICAMELDSEGVLQLVEWKGTLANAWMSDKLTACCAKLTFPKDCEDGTWGSDSSGLCECSIGSNNPDLNMPSASLCAKYPTLPYCACVNSELPQPQCWDVNCANTGAFRTSGMLGAEGKGCGTFCEIAVNVRGDSDNFNDVLFQQECGGTTVDEGTSATTVVIGGAIAAGVLLLILALYFFMRPGKKTPKGPSNPPSSALPPSSLRPASG